MMTVIRSIIVEMVHDDYINNVKDADDDVLLPKYYVYMEVEEDMWKYTFQMIFLFMLLNGL